MKKRWLLVVVLLSGVVRAELVVDTSIQYSKKSWGVSVSEVAIPGVFFGVKSHYDILWDFYSYQDAWFNRVSNSYEFSQRWSTACHYKMSGDSIWDHARYDQGSNMLSWGFEHKCIWSCNDVFYGPTGFRTPSGVPDSHIKEVLHEVGVDFTAIWPGPGGLEDRTAVGDWFSTAGGLGYHSNADTQWQLKVSGWVDREPMPWGSDHVQIKYQGAEFDYLWGHQTCHNGRYEDFKSISPTSDGWYPVPTHTNIGMGCSSGLRFENGSDRDHGIYVCKGYQALLP